MAVAQLPKTAAPSGGFVPKTALEKFAAGVLRAIGSPVTAANVHWFEAWANLENTAARNNPLATTQTETGSTPLPGNSAGVQQYPTAAAGIKATAQTLEGYPSIVAAFKSGDITAVSFTNSPSLIREFTIWSQGFPERTNDPAAARAAGLAYFQQIKLGAQGNPSGKTAGDIGSFDLGNAGTAAADVAKKATAPLTGWVGDLTGWLTSQGKLVLAYVLLVGVAGGLVLTGLKGLGVPTPRVPAVVPV
jgi:hypothetical protein